MERHLSAKKDCLLKLAAKKGLSNVIPPKPEEETDDKIEIENFSVPENEDLLKAIKSEHEVQHNLHKCFLCGEICDATSDLHLHFDTVHFEVLTTSLNRYTRLHKFNHPISKALQ